MNRLRSLGCVVNGEWVGSPRLQAHAHVVSDKKKQIGESENKEEATPERPFFLLSRRGESDTGKPPDAPAVDLTLQTSPRSVQILYLYLLLPPPLRFRTSAFNHTVKPRPRHHRLPHRRGILEVNLRGNAHNGNRCSPPCLRAVW